jgi:hypothetical protein
MAFDFLREWLKAAHDTFKTQKDTRRRFQPASAAI